MLSIPHDCLESVHSDCDALCLPGICPVWLVVACVVDALCDFQSLEITSYTGVLIWKITDFAKKRQDARQGRIDSFYSPPFYTSQTGQYTQGTVSGHLLHLTDRLVHSGHCLRPPSTPHRQVSTLRSLSQATFYTSQTGQYTQATVSGHLLHLTDRQVSTLRPLSQATFYTSQTGQYTQATVSGHLLHLTGRSVHSGHCLWPPSTPNRQVSTLRPLSLATFYTSQAGKYTQTTVSGHLLHLTDRQVSTLRPLSQATFYTSQTDRSVHSGHCLRPPSTPHRQVSTLRPLSQATFYTSQTGQYTQATVSGHLLHLTGRSVHSGHCLWPPSTPNRQVSTLRPLSLATFYTSQAGKYTQTTVSGHLLHLTDRQVSTLRPLSQATFYTSQTDRSVHSGHCLRPPSTPHRQVSALRPLSLATFYTSQAGQYTQATVSGHLQHLTGNSIHSGHLQQATFSSHLPYLVCSSAHSIHNLKSSSTPRG